MTDQSGRGNDSQFVSMDPIAQRSSANHVKRLLLSVGNGAEWKAEADAIIGEVCPSADSRLDGIDYLYSIVKLMLSDTPKARALSHELHALGYDWDEAVLTLWSTISGERDEVERRYAPIVFHRIRFFEWFLGRYNIPAARQIYAAPTMVRWIHYAFFILLIGTFIVASYGVRLDWEDLWRWIPLGIGLVYTLVVAVQWRAFNRKERAELRVMLACQTLIPRLAGTAIVGLLFLASSPTATRFLVQHGGWLGAAGLVAFAWFLMALGAARRIQPIPAPRHFLARVTDVTVTGFGHALAVTILGAPLIEALLRVEGGGSTGTIPCPAQRACLAAVILVIGLIINVIWEEEPVTTPL